MLSGKLIQLIESHWDQISTRVLEQIRQDPELRHIRGLPDAEIREWTQNLLRNLGHWLTSAADRDIAAHYEALGRLRFEESIPLAECVRGLSFLRSATEDFVQGQGLSRTSLDLYAEEELEIRIGRFFDMLLFHLVLGYERAMMKAAHAHA